MPGATEGNTKWPVRPARVASGRTFAPLDCGTGSRRTTVRASGRPEACSSTTPWIVPACIQTAVANRASTRCIVNAMTVSECGTWSQNLARWKQAVDIHFAFRSNVHFAVHHSWNIEPKAESGPIAGAVLLAVVEFMGDISRVEGIKNRWGVGRPPAFRTKNPDNAVARSICRYGWRGARIDELRCPPRHRLRG